MDNFSLLLLGAGLTASGSVAYRGSSRYGVQALAAGAVAPGFIMLFVAFVNAFSGTG